MGFDFEEAMEEPAFWFLAGGGVAAELIGWIISKRMMENSFPFWQLLIMMVVTVVAAVFFSTKE